MSDATGRRRMAGRWLPDMDLNHDKQIQSLLCYRYTIGQTSALKVKLARAESRKQALAKAPSTHLDATTRPERGIYIYAASLSELSEAHLHPGFSPLCTLKRHKCRAPAVPSAVGRTP